MNKDPDDTVSPIILNMGNIIPSSFNNVYSYNFPGSANFKGAKIAVSQVQIFYSWRNITSGNQNNAFSIIVPTGAGPVTVSITVPDGTYSVSDLNSYIQNILISRGYYLVNAQGAFIYYVEIVENSTRYAIQLNMFPVPTVLPTGWSNPGGWSLPVAVATPRLVVPNTSFQSYLGFLPGTYPPASQSAAYSTLSSFTPQVSPVSSVIMGCNLVQNPLANPQTTLYSFSPGTASYGGLIQSNAFDFSYVRIPDGTYSSLDITFYDQNFNNLAIVDTNIIIVLLIKIPA